MRILLCENLPKVLVRLIDAMSLTRISSDARLVMEMLTISPEYQVVIPKEIREALHLSPGQKVQAVVYEGRIELIPVRPIQSMKGFLKGIDTDVPREGDHV